LAWGADATPGLTLTFIPRSRALARLSAELYPDVWDEEPVNSLYWVSRFRSAKQIASRLTGDAAQEMQERLRERAQEWIYRFQYKGNFRLLLEILRTAGDGLLDQQEVQLSLFESLIDRIERGDINALNRAESMSEVMTPLSRPSLTIGSTFDFSVNRRRKSIETTIVSFSFCFGCSATMRRECIYPPHQSWLW
jgi:hypothetical protein